MAIFYERAKFTGKNLEYKIRNIMKLWKQKIKLSLVFFSKKNTFLLIHTNKRHGKKMQQDKCW